VGWIGAAIVVWTGVDLLAAIETAWTGLLGGLNRVSALLSRG
jgi:hypothetical protein